MNTWDSRGELADREGGGVGDTWDSRAELVGRGGGGGGDTLIYF